MKSSVKIFKNLPENPAVQAAKWGYGLGAGLCVFGVLVLGIALGQIVDTGRRGIHRLTVPGRASISLKEGLYVGASLSGDISSFAGCGMELRAPDDGLIPLNRTPATDGLKIGNQTAYPLFQCEIFDGGKYAYAAECGGFGAEPRDVYMVHSSASRNLPDLIVGGILFAVMTGGGIFIIFWTRRKIKKSLNPLPKK